jgi:hypothetical protein
VASANLADVHSLGVTMNRRFLSRGTLVEVAGIAVSFALAPLASAAAAPPVHTVDDFGFEIDDMCAFPVDIKIHSDIDTTVSTTAQGSTTTLHVTETDTLSANGNTVHGLPYHATGRFIFDTAGNLARIVVQGEIWRLRLPDGRIISVGGREQWFPLPEEIVGSLKPDTFAPVCAALAA